MGYIFLFHFFVILSSFRNILWKQMPACPAYRLPAGGRQGIRMYMIIIPAGVFLNMLILF
jgi:hypothetical protein